MGTRQCRSGSLVISSSPPQVRHVILAQNDKVEKYMTKFKRTASEPYTLITPSSPLADLEEFLKHNIFALGTTPPFLCLLALRTHDFLVWFLVTDYDRKFVLAV